MAPARLVGTGRPLGSPMLLESLFGKSFTPEGKEHEPGDSTTRHRMVLPDHYPGSPGCRFCESRPASPYRADRTPVGTNHLRSEMSRWVVLPLLIFSLVIMVLIWLFLLV